MTVFGMLYNQDLRRGKTRVVWGSPCVKYGHRYSRAGGDGAGGDDDLPPSVSPEIAVKLYGDAERRATAVLQLQTDFALSQVGVFVAGRWEDLGKVGPRCC